MINAIGKSNEGWNKVSDSMPTNKTPVLVVATYYGTSRVIIRAFHAAKRTVISDDWDNLDGDSAGEKEEHYLPEGWYEWTQEEDPHWKISGKVTHWMPLPNLPEEGKYK